MSPKYETKQPQGGPQGRKRGRGKPPPEGLFWVSMTEPRNAAELYPGQHLMLDVGEGTVEVFDGERLLGVLEHAGVAWVRAHGYSSCVFVQYANSRRERFQVRIAGE